MYQAVLGPTAKKRFEAFPYYIQEAIADRIEELCADPGKHSRSATFPYAPTGQVSILKVPKPKSSDFVVVSLHFRFGQDESTLQFFAIGSYVLGVGDSDDE